MIAIIDYKAGNLTSVRLALESIGAACSVTSDPKVISSAERIIFPGVGAAASAMKNIREMGLDKVILSTQKQGVPFLGICLGTQILFETSEEDGNTEMLGILPGFVKRFIPSSNRDKVPHMGWNQVHFPRRHPIFDSIDNNSDFYFVHSFYPAPKNNFNSIGETTFAGITFTSAVAMDNVVATQFHIEKSGKTGLRVLQNFLGWNGKDAAQC